MRRKIIPYNPILKPLAKALRKTMSLAEILLWDELKQKKIMGFDFDRQRPIDEYIVDFYCKDLTLAIEVDDESHEYKFHEDQIRQKRLEYLGVTVIRFSDDEVKYDIENVVSAVEYWVEKLRKPTPTPLRGGEYRSSS